MYKCLVVTDEFLTVSWYQPNEFISWNKMVFSTEDLVLIKFFVKKKVTTIDEWSHCFIGDSCERAQVLCFGRVIENMS